MRTMLDFGVVSPNGQGSLLTLAVNVNTHDAYDRLGFDVFKNI
jgi:hypothetical protein